MPEPTNELFPPTVRVRAGLQHLAVASAVADRLGSDDVEILVYGREHLLPNPWFCFDVGERKFAIWRTTGLLYECDADGAVTDDAIDVEDLNGEGELTREEITAERNRLARALSERWDADPSDPCQDLLDEVSALNAAALKDKRRGDKR